MEVNEPIPSKKGKKVHVHAGIIQEFNREYLVLKEQSTIHNGKWYVIYDSKSRNAFLEMMSHHGLHEPQSRQTRIHHKKCMFYIAKQH